MAAPTLDGHVAGTASSTNTKSVTLTTANANDVICVLAFAENNTSASPSVSSISGGGLTWTKRKSVTTSAGYSQYELWYAVAPSALSSASLTATWSSNFDDCSVVAFGVSGCNTSAPFDGNASVPATWASSMVSGNDTPSVSGISTTNANDFLIFGFGTAGGQAALGTPPSGFSSIDFASTSGGIKFAANGAAYKGVTAAQSSQSFSWGTPIAVFNGALAIFDALTADAAPATNNTKGNFFFH